MNSSISRRQILNMVKIEQPINEWDTDPDFLAISFRLNKD